MKGNMRVAIVQDMMVGYTGSERVLEQMLNVFPEADLFSVIDFVPDSQRTFLQGKIPKTSFVQKFPFAKSKFRFYLPFMPLAVEQFDVSSYDLVLSSSHAVAKGVLTGPDQLHICMCYSPIRYAWDLQHQYLNETKLTRGFKSMLARMILHYMRLWDTRTSNGVDVFIAISKFISRRIKKAYGRDSVVMYPPIDTESFVPTGVKEDFYFTSSRLVPYKRIDLIVEAFSKMPDKRLIVIGTGPEMAKIQAKASSNVQLLGYQPFNVLREHMQKAKAFVFAAEEDFGIVPLEAQACGTPVIAFGKGGSLETVIGGKTGLFFSEQSVKSLIEAVKSFESMSFDARVIRSHAELFSADRFRHELRTLIDTEWVKFKALLSQ
jgi:glycosyltransferase involved in cell wall biosynthesis